jgi:dihydrofolate reductase
MGKLIVQVWMTLDGVVQAPGDAQEDTTGGFRHGGWSLPYFEDASMKWTIGNLNEVDAFLLGRRTYEGFAAHWPNAQKEEQPLAAPLNAKPKYVASTTLADPLEWDNSTVLQGDAAEAVARLKKDTGEDLLAIGSATLVQGLIEHGLVDEFRLMIDPLVVGGGKRIFPDDGALRKLELVQSQTTPAGVMLATYVPAKR